MNKVINGSCCSRSIYFSKFSETCEEAEGLISLHIPFLLVVVWKSCAPGTYLVAVSQVSLL